jgi:2-polyprenyl-6-methoxyphenol hydroxylase-like FAD-dependent oxidoreductase
MALSPDICIRGAGIVGRTLALLLARERLNVALVESPQPNTAPDVRAYSLNGAAKALLQDLRCWPEDPAVTPVHQMQVWGDDGGQLNFGAREQGVGELNWMVDVPVLQALLAQAVQFQPQIQVVQAPVSAPLTVVCEGRASQTRAELGVGFDITHYEQHALATRLVCERAHQGIARQWFGWSQVPGLAQPQAEVLALLPWGAKAGAKSRWSGRCTRCGRKHLMAMSPEDVFSCAGPILRPRPGRHAAVSRACRVATATGARRTLDWSHARHITNSPLPWRAMPPSPAPAGGSRPERGPGRCGRTGEGDPRQRILAAACTT